MPCWGPCPAPAGCSGLGAGLTPPAPLAPATAAVLLTLVDAETPISLAPDLMAAAEWIAFHCGASVTEAAAEFVVATSLPALGALDAGSDEAPEASATLILQVAALGEGTPLRLAGPGLREPATLRVLGLGAGFVAAWADNHALFPRGVDLVLCAGETVTALPRTVAITEG